MKFGRDSPSKIRWFTTNPKTYLFVLILYSLNLNNSLPKKKGMEARSEILLSIKNSCSAGTMCSDVSKINLNFFFSGIKKG